MLILIVRIVSCLNFRVEKSLLDECGLTESDLQSILMANQDNERVQQVFMNMQIDNQKIMRKHGIMMQ